MGKIEIKQQALQLHKEGYSYGEIEKETGIPRSTAFRWVNDPDGTIGTPETHYGTAFETNIIENETDSQGYGTVKETFQNDNTMKSEDLSKVEIEKAKLEHQYKMAELEFRRQQYETEQKLGQNSSEALKLASKVEQLSLELEKYKREKQELSENKEVNGRNPEKMEFKNYPSRVLYTD